LPNLPTESTLLSQDEPVFGFDQSSFTQAESDYGMSTISMPAVNSIDLADGLHEVFNVDIETSVAEGLICYGMVSFTRLLILLLVFKKDLYL
jgi:hypothetical protein